MALFRVSAEDKKEMFYKGEYPLAKLTLMSYLEYFYRQAIKEPVYADEFTNWKQPSLALSVAVLAYIFPDTTTNYSMLDASTALQVRKVEKDWAYGTLDEDKALKDFIIKTLQFRCFFEGKHWVGNSDEGIRAKEILDHYNSFTNEPIKFRKYSMMVLRWKSEVQKIGAKEL